MGKEARGYGEPCPECGVRPELVVRACPNHDGWQLSMHCCEHVLDEVLDEMYAGAKRQPANPPTA